VRLYVTIQPQIYKQIIYHFRVVSARRFRKKIIADQVKNLTLQRLYIVRKTNQSPLVAFVG